MEIYDEIAEMQFAVYSNEMILRESFNPIWLYMEKEEGNLIDIGCGNTSHILSFLKTNMNLYALDPSPVQIKFLQRRVEALVPGRLVDYKPEKFNPDLYPDINFDVVILSNLLHLKDYIPDPIKFLVEVEKVMASKALVLIEVHSESKADSESHRRFNEEDLQSLLPFEKYEILLTCFITGQPNVYTKKFLRTLINKKVRNPIDKENRILNAINDSKVASKVILCRRLI